MADWAGRAPFRARRWLAGGHVQTIASFLLPRKIHLPTAEERLVEVAPGIKIRCWCYWQEKDRTQPLTVCAVSGASRTYGPLMRTRDSAGPA